jgi:hypothetical protein
MLMNRIRTYAYDLVDKVVRQLFENPILRRFLDMSMERHWRIKAQISCSPLLHRGEKFHSQNDEDGIISAILRRLKIDRGVFVEYGCGDGLENNTIQLLMRGWSGVWIGAADLSIQIPASSRKLQFEQEWVTLGNCVQIMQRGIQRIGANEVNLVSMDLDGNDLFFVQAILEHGFEPDVFVVEYNGKFPPPIRFSIDYDPAYSWSGSDYFGASLQSFIDVFDSFGFRLVCCNVTGANAFFVARRHAGLFADVSKEAEELFMPPDYNWFLRRGHAPDPRSIEHFLCKDLDEGPAQSPIALPHRGPVARRDYLASH